MSGKSWAEGQVPCLNLPQRGCKVRVGRCISYSVLKAQGGLKQDSVERKESIILRILLWKKSTTQHRLNQLSVAP